MLAFLKLYDRLKNKLFTLAIGRSMKRLGQRSTIELPLRSSGEQGISIGNDVYIGADCWIACFQRDSAQHARIQIGNRCSISGHCTITSKDSVELEEGVLIARYVYISDHSHSYNDVNTPIRDQGTTPANPVKIKRGAWIGQGAVICPGVTVGANSVVAANSIVKDDVPDHAIAAGAPARIVKQIKP